MAFQYPQDINGVINDIIDNRLNNIKTIDIFIVTDINETNYTVNIKHPNFKQFTYENVPICGTGLGNFTAGIMKLPTVDSFVVCAFIGKEDENPIIIGTVFDMFTSLGDGIPQIKTNEVFINNKPYGSYLIIKENDDVIIRTTKNGDKSLGSRLRLNSDGSFKMFNKDNYGIECDINGNIIMRGVTINHTQTPGGF